MMPDTSEVEAKSEIEKLVNPDLLAYDIQKASEKTEYNETIVNINSLNHRILILVDGKRSRVSNSALTNTRKWLVQMVY